MVKFISKEERALIDFADSLVMRTIYSSCHYGVGEMIKALKDEEREKCLELKAEHFGHKSDFMCAMIADTPRRLTK